MKKSITKAPKHFLLGLLILISLMTCDKETNFEDRSGVNSSENYKVESIKTLKYIDINSTGVKRKVQNFNKIPNANSASRENWAQIIIDTTSITQITTTNGYTSYTFNVLNTESHHVIENVIISTFSNDNIQTVLVEHHLNESLSGINPDRIDQSIAYSTFSFLGKDNEIIESSTEMARGYSCLTAGYYTEVDKCEGDLHPGPDCFDGNGQPLKKQVYVLVAEACGFDGDGGPVNGGGGSGGSGGSGGGSGGSGGSGGGGGSSTSDYPDGVIITAPNLNLGNELIEILNVNFFTETQLVNFIRNDWNYSLVDDCIVTELFNFLLSNDFSESAIAEARMRLEIEYVDSQGGWDFSQSGTFLNREALDYVATHHPLNSDGTMYLLQNGKVLYVTQTQRNINGTAGLFGSNEEPNYHYIYDYGSKRWYEFNLPAANYNCLSCDLNSFFEAVLENGGLIIGRYILPIEDVLIVVTGEDFYGAEQSRAVAAAFILVDIIPGSELVKGIKLIKYGDEAIQVAEAVIKYADDIYKSQKAIIKEVLDGTEYLINNTRSGNFGEMIVDVDVYEKGYEFINRTEGVISLSDTAIHTNGIDHIIKNPRTGEYVLIETKYNRARLSRNTNYGAQMSEEWIEHHLNNLPQNLGNIGDDILDSGYTSVLAQIAPNGTITYTLLDEYGQKIIGSNWMQ